MFLGYRQLGATGAGASVGSATLRHVDRSRAVLLAATPLLFTLDHFAEAFAWLQPDGQIGRVAFEHALFLLMLSAQSTLPLVTPWGVLLMEQRGSRGNAARWRSQPRSGPSCPPRLVTA